LLAVNPFVLTGEEVQQGCYHIAVETLDEGEGTGDVADAEFMDDGGVFVAVQLHERYYVVLVGQNLAAAPFHIGILIARAIVNGEFLQLIELAEVAR